jgi:hypothetical protein
MQNCCRSDRSPPFWRYINVMQCAAHRSKWGVASARRGGPGPATGPSTADDPRRHPEVIPRRVRGAAPAHFVNCGKHHNMTGIHALLPSATAAASAAPPYPCVAVPVVKAHLGDNCLAWGVGGAQGCCLHILFRMRCPEIRHPQPPPTKPNPCFNVCLGL